MSNNWVQKGKKKRETFLAHKINKKKKKKGNDCNIENNF